MRFCAFGPALRVDPTGKRMVVKGSGIRKGQESPYLSFSDMALRYIYSPDAYLTETQQSFLSPFIMV